MFKFNFLILFFMALNAYALKKVSNETEFSSIATRGNSPYESYNTKTLSRLEFENSHEITVGGHYSYGTINADQFEIVRNWDFNTNYLIAISEKTYMFVGAVVEGDEFAGFSERNNIDLGLSTKFLNKDEFKVFFDYGVRQTVELPTDGSGPNKDQKLRFKGSLDKKLNANTSFAFWLEYIPNLTTPEDYMVNFGPSFRASITRIFSLKVSFKGLYDNKPAISSRKYFDETYTTSLLAKF